MFCVVYSISLERLIICIFILFNVKVMWICVLNNTTLDVVCTVIMLPLEGP